jgi:hypothetical protein
MTATDHADGSQSSVEDGRYPLQESEWMSSTGSLSQETITDLDAIHVSGFGPGGTIHDAIHVSWFGPPDRHRRMTHTQWSASGSTTMSALRRLSVS